MALVLLVSTAAVRAQTIFPDPTAGLPYSFQITTNPPQAAGTAYAADGLPTGLSLDGSTGVISGTTETLGLFKGTLTLSLGSEISTYPFQITVDPAPGTPTITSSGSSVGTVGTPLVYLIEASNNPTGYTLAQLPPGLTASGAQISGTPTEAGLFFTSVSANNANGQGMVLVLMFTISPQGPVPVITSALLISDPVGTPLAYTITAANAPTSFSASALPSGLSVNASTGVISGTPTVAQVASVPISASNAYGPSLPINLILTIGSLSAITSATAVTGTAGNGISYTLTASNSPVGFTLTGQPAGLTFNSATGVISGTPTTPGSYTLSASATNALGVGPATAITFAVTDPATGQAAPIAPLIIASPLPVSATVGSTAQFSVSAAGSGALSYQWSLGGIAISGATGPALQIASVQASNAGSYRVAVTNSIGTTLSAPASLTILSLFVPPAITSEPSKASVTVGSAASFTAGASGTAPLAYQWLFDGSPIAGATAATFTLPNVSVSDAGTYSLVASNPAGSATSAGAVLTVSGVAYAPIFQYQPSATYANAGGEASLSVGIVGSPPITYQWLKGGTAVPGATSASLTFAPVAATDAGTYSVAITNPAATVTSSGAALTVGPVGGPPVSVSIVLQPAPVSTTVGTNVTFTVAVNGDAPITYQWQKNQSPIAGATGPSFTIANVQYADAGTYDVDVANGFSAVISFPTLLTVTPSGSPSRLTNVSTRGFTGSGSQTLTLGLVAQGTGTTSALVRAVGPSLAAFGLTGLLADPQLVLYSATGAPVASNDNWGGTPALTTAFEMSGAFALPPASLDAAVLTNLPPGMFTAQATGAAGGTGTVLLEVYDVDTNPLPTAQYVNVSSRGFVGVGANILTVGFVITGPSNMTVLIRGVGPTLATFGVPGALADVQLTLLDSDQNILGYDDGWGGTAALQAAFSAVGAFTLPAASKDSALLVSLAPGSYTAQARGANGSTGIALLEVYGEP